MDKQIKVLIELSEEMIDMLNHFPLSLEEFALFEEKLQEREGLIEHASEMKASLSEEEIAQITRYNEELIVLMNEKLDSFRGEIGQIEHRRKELSQFRKMHKGYGGVNKQSEGFFIDRKK